MIYTHDPDLTVEEDIANLERCIWITTIILEQEPENEGMRRYQGKLITILHIVKGTTP